MHSPSTRFYNCVSATRSSSSNPFSAWDKHVSSAPVTLGLFPCLMGFFSLASTSASTRFFRSGLQFPHHRKNEIPTAKRRNDQTNAGAPIRLNACCRANPGLYGSVERLVTPSISRERIGGISLKFFAIHHEIDVFRSYFRLRGCSMSFATGPYRKTHIPPSGRGMAEKPGDCAPNENESGILGKIPPPNVIVSEK